MADKIGWEDILAGGAGAANEVLFGAPEWLIRKLGGGKQLDEKLAQYKKAHDIGSTVGLLGSALVPGKAIAKGVLKGGKAALGLAKGAKEAETALDVLRAGGEVGETGRLAKLAEAGKAAEGLAKAPEAARSILSYAGRGAGLGAAEQGARGFFKDEEPEQISKDVASGTLFGGLGGAAGGAISKFAPMLARLGKKATEKATIGLTNARTRDLLQTVQRLSGEGSGPMAQVRNVDDVRRELSDIIKAKKLYREGATESASYGVKSNFDKFDKIYEKTVGGQKGAEVLRGSLKAGDIQSLQSKYDPEILKEAIDKVMKPVANRTGLANIRSKLEDVAQYARKGKEESSEVANAMFDVAKIIRSNLDDAVLKAAEAAGEKIPANFKREYGLLLPIAKGEVRSEIAPTKFGLGSPTFEKAAAASLLGGGGFLTGGADEDLGTKAKRAALGAALGFGGQKLLSAGLRRGVSAADTLAGLAEKAAPKLAEETGKLSGTAARETANVARAAQAAAPETEGEAEAAQDGAELGQAKREDYMSLVLSKLTDYAEANGIARDSPDFKDFISTVGGATQGTEGPFDAEKMAGLLYPDPAERSTYLRALKVSRGLSANLPVALKSAGGFMGMGQEPETKIEKTAALDQLAETIGEVAEASGGTKAAAKKMLDTIVKSRVSQTEKRRMIQALMENYGVDFSTLGRVGLNV